MNTDQSSVQSEEFAAIRAKWGWFLALGVIFITLGVAAVGNLLLATIATVYYVGVLISVSGVIHVIHSFQVKNWGGFFLWILSGVFYTAAGVVSFIDPLLVSSPLTLALALFFALAGLSRFWLGLRSRSQHGWGWIVVSGVATMIAGLVFVLSWPLNSLWLLGLILSIDLIFQGFTLLGWALRLSEDDQKWADQVL